MNYHISMIQLYIVSVFSLVLSGTILASPLIDEKITLPKIFNREMLESPNFQLLAALITFVTGFLQFLFAPFGGVAVIGNLFPALGGIIAGFSIGLLYYQAKATVISPRLEKIIDVFIGNRDVVGVLVLIIALLHFLLPTVILL